MNGEKWNDVWRKIKGVGLRKKYWVMGVVVVALAAIGGWAFYQSQPKSVLSTLEVTFDGYDGHGTITYDSDKIDKEIYKIALQSAGFNKEQVTKIIKAMEDYDYGALEEFSDPKNWERLEKTEELIDSVSYEFDKTADLKNGDKVTLTVTVSSSKSPIKEETKTYTVKGLKKIETISTKDFLKDHPVTFVGFNGYGSVAYSDDDVENSVFSTGSSSGKDGDSDAMSGLKNGDKVTVNVSESYLKELLSKGKELKSSAIELEVSGLSEITDIGNLSDGLSKNDTYAKSNYKNSSSTVFGETTSTTYTIEKQKDYIAYKTGYSSWSSTDSSAQLYLVSVYKITKVYDGYGSDPETTVNYCYYGYRYYLNDDNTLDLETANKTSGYATQDYENLQAELETDGYKEYTTQ